MGVGRALSSELKYPLLFPLWPYPPLGVCPSAPYHVLLLKFFVDLSGFFDHLFSVCALQLVVFIHVCPLTCVLHRAFHIPSDSPYFLRSVCALGFLHMCPSFCVLHVSVPILRSVLCVHPCVFSLPLYLPICVMCAPFCILINSFYIVGASPEDDPFLGGSSLSEKVMVGIFGCQHPPDGPLSDLDLGVLRAAIHYVLNFMINERMLDLLLNQERMNHGIHFLVDSC